MIHRPLLENIPNALDIKLRIRIPKPLKKRLQVSREKFVQLLLCRKRLAPELAVVCVEERVHPQC